jgi:hypothetical protein
VSFLRVLLGDLLTLLFHTIQVGYHEVKQVCYECPSYQKGLVAVACVIAFIIIFLLTTMISGILETFQNNQDKLTRLVSVLSLLLNFVQIQVFITFFEIPWPYFFRVLAQILRIFLFDFEFFLSPECVFQYSYSQKWSMIALVPVISIGLLMPLAVAILIKSKGIPFERRYFFKLWGTTALLFLNVVFLIFAMHTLSVFDCVKAGSVEVMRAANSIVCDSSDPEYSALLGNLFSVFLRRCTDPLLFLSADKVYPAIVFYIVVPILVVIAISIKYPDEFVFVRQYAPGRHAFVGLVFVNRLGLACVQQFMSSNPRLMVIICLVLAIIWFWICVFSTPFTGIGRSPLFTCLCLALAHSYSSFRSF